VGKTIIEKIIETHSEEKSVSPGDVVWIEIDGRTARDFGGANVVLNYQREFGQVPVADIEKTWFTFDCVVPAKNIPYANNQQICREFARKQGIRVFDVDMGIGSHVNIEQGLILPGAILVGTDSHLNILGAIGAFGQGMGDVDIAFAFRTGKTWFELPETMKMVIKGGFNHPVSPKDLTLYIVRRLGSSGALGRAIEFYGEAVNALSLDGRITLASMVTEMGGIVGFITPDERVIEFCRMRSGKPDISPVYPDPAASYIETVEIDITGLSPQIALPSKPDNVVDVAEAAGERVDSVFIGSCTNGRVEDFEVVAGILKGKKVANGVMFRAVPATREVYGELLKRGILEMLYDAGVIISNPGCGGCASGQIGMTGKGEVQLSTGNRNFAGKQGAGLTYLASPATAAFSALTGKITVPE
jgi:3-isopropylmalate/(R)-2-methylmalate dehydratase large subunit